MIAPTSSAKADGGDSAPADVSASHEEHDESERWVPSVGILGTFLFQNANASVTTTPVLGPPVPIPPPPAPQFVGQPLQPGSPLFGSERMVTPTFGTTVELMTPRLLDGFAKPRLFGHADVHFAFPPSYKIVAEGVPGPFAIAGRPSLIAEETILGQGSTITAEVDSLIFTAGLGIAFSFDIDDRRLRVKPSVEYIREEMGITAVTRRAVQLTNPALNGLSDFRFVAFEQSITKVFHGVGPGLEVELDAARKGSVMVSVLTGVSVYIFGGDRDANFDQRNAFGETAYWFFEKEQVAYRGHVGVRLRYVGD